MQTACLLRKSNIFVHFWANERILLWLKVHPRQIAARTALIAKEKQLLQKYKGKFFKDKAIYANSSITSECMGRNHVNKIIANCL